MSATDIRQTRDRLNALLLERIESLVRHLYPDGRKEGHSWRVGSFDINLRTGLWGDWDGSTDSMSRNLFDLWMYATHHDFKTVLQEVRTWLGVHEDERNLGTDVREKEPEPAKKLVLPLLEKPTVAELSRLSSQRSIALEPLQIAAQRGFLWTYTDRAENVRAWLLTDSARKLAIARRLDGIPWAKINAKSWTLPNSWGHWPIGIMEAQAYPAIGLVEGTPDFLALIAQAWTSQVQNLVAPVCMSGAAMSIPESVLPRFRSKRVRIFMHDDNPGISAANRWAEQLKSAEVQVDGYSFEGLVQINGFPVEDLNDLCRIDPESLEANAKDLAQLFNFVPRSKPLTQYGQGV